MPSDPIVYTTDVIKTLYYLLYAKYGNSTIASTDEEQFKYKVWMTIFQYGPAWKMRLKIQEKLMNIDPGTDAGMKALQEGTVMLYNHAENPDTAPSTDTFDALAGINSQNTSNVKRGKLESYAMLNALISTDVTEEFLGKFKKLFLKFLAPQKPLWYSEVGDENTEDPDVPFVNTDPLFGNYINKKFTDVWADADTFAAEYAANGIPTTI